MRRHRLPPIRPQGPSTLGYTLVEVVIAMLISSIMVTAMFGVALTSKQSSGKNDRRLLASQAARQITSQLRSYVTGCGCNPSTGDCSACNTSLLSGPNTANGAGAASWYMNGGGITDSRGNVYALACNNHVLTGAGIIPPNLQDPIFNASVSYNVTYPGGCPTSVSATSAPKVDVTVNWTEP